MEYLVFRQTDSVTHVNYQKFKEIFEEDYLLEESPYEKEEGQESQRSSLR